MKLRANKNGRGYITSYTVSIGCAEARRAGLIDPSGTTLEIEKHIDENQKSITITLKKDAD